MILRLRLLHRQAGYGLMSQERQHGRVFPGRKLRYITTTDAPFQRFGQSSPVRVLTPDLGDARLPRVPAREAW